MDLVNNQNSIPDVPYHTHNGMDSPPIIFKQPAITSPSGGAMIDAESRTAIDLIITALEKNGILANN